MEGLNNKQLLKDLVEEKLPDLWHQRVHNGKIYDGHDLEYQNPEENVPNWQLLKSLQRRQMEAGEGD